MMRWEGGRKGNRVGAHSVNVDDEYLVAKATQGDLFDMLELHTILH